MNTRRLVVFVILITAQQDDKSRWRKPIWAALLSALRARHLSGSAAEMDVPAWPAPK